MQKPPPRSLLKRGRPVLLDASIDFSRIIKTFFEFALHIEGKGVKHPTTKDFVQIRLFNDLSPTPETFKTSAITLYPPKVIEQDESEVYP